MNDENTIAARLGRISTTELEQAIREQPEAIIQGEDAHDQIRADAINAVLRAKGMPPHFTPYEAAKVFTILSHLEELAGYSG